MIFDLVLYLVVFVLVCIALILLSVLYKRFCSESAHYSVVGNNSTKASRSPLYPVLEPGANMGSAPPIDLSDADSAEKGALQKKDSFKNEKLERVPETKAVENDYVNPAELNIGID